MPCVLNDAKILRSSRPSCRLTHVPQGYKLGPSSAKVAYYLGLPCSRVPLRSSGAYPALHQQA
eukprot:8460281-Pyramimonas_sp.AAC.1